MTELLSCDWAGRCSGCTWIRTPYADQLSGKVQYLCAQWEAGGLPVEALGEPRIAEIAHAGLRDRVDLIFRGGCLGLYDMERATILPLGKCPQLSPPLEQWFAEVGTHPPPIATGSIRLRVSPAGERGAWLDFANLDVKSLLQEGNWLRWLLSRAVVEIGQRRKRLEEKDGLLVLGKPLPEQWLSTFLGDTSQPLFSVVGGFTQVGTAANRVLIEELMRALPTRVEGRWVELGAGIGNFTLPLAFRGARVDAVENDPLALEAMPRSAAAAGLAEQIVSHPLSFHQPSERLGALLRGAQGILADPPRSGILRFTELLAALAPEERPRHFVYVSCFADSFARDAGGLYRLGYRLEHLTGVDQFPQTPHCEWIARFSLPEKAD